MEFDASFFEEEVRCDHLITKEMKKVWAAEMNILGGFDKICRKHHLRYYAAYGTLLGAVRHQGFVPWDDDIDVWMFRKDYEAFKKIATEEVHAPYFFQDTYTDTMLWAFSKIRDSRTSAIENFEAPKSFNQGIFIDIFPLDDAPDDINYKSIVLDIQREIWMTMIRTEDVRELLADGYPFKCGADVISELLQLSQRERFREFENFNLSQAGKSTQVHYIVGGMFKKAARLERKWFSEVEYFPFENIRVPVPASYCDVLTNIYGDYMEIVKNNSQHQNIFFDTEKPYTSYL